MSSKPKSENSTKRKAPGTAFPKGVSGNPGGRPKKLKELQLKIQERGEELVASLFAIVESTGEVQDSDRIKAATKLLEYGYGKPHQTVEIKEDLSGLTDEELAARLIEELANMPEGQSALMRKAMELKGGK